MQEYFSKLKINEDKKGLNNSFDDSLIDFCTNRLKFEEVNENKENNQSKNTSEKTIKKTCIIKGNNITKEIEIIEDSIKNKIPWRIKYKNYIYYIAGSNPEKQTRITWYCQNYRKIKGKPIGQDKYCTATIQGQRSTKEIKDIIYYEKNKHSKICLQNTEKIDEEKKAEIKAKIENKTLSQKEDKLIDNIKTKKDFNEYLEEYLKRNKNIIITCSEFIKFAKKQYYNLGLNNNFHLNDIYFKNLYYKIKKSLYQFNLEGIYEYSKRINNDEYFCRYISLKMLISKDKKLIEHKSIIFFTDFDIKRFASSEHILIDGTFIYPIEYMQTIIFMYYDIIIEKMIPGIFIVTNNKTEEGYFDSFHYIKDYIDNMNKTSKKILWR